MIAIGSHGPAVRKATRLFPLSALRALPLFGRARRPMQYGGRHEEIENGRRGCGAKIGPIPR